jgi:hypothetical protein
MHLVDIEGLFAHSNYYTKIILYFTSSDSDTGTPFIPINFLQNQVELKNCKSLFLRA